MRTILNGIWEAIKFIGLAIISVIGGILCFFTIVIAGGIILGLIGLLSPLIVVAIFVIGVIACFFVIYDLMTDQW